jgi:hypothetical protein
VLIGGWDIGVGLVRISVAIFQLLIAAASAVWWSLPAIAYEADYEKLVGIGQSPKEGDDILKKQSYMPPGYVEKIQKLIKSHGEKCPQLISLMHLGFRAGKLKLKAECSPPHWELNSTWYLIIYPERPLVLHCDFGVCP